MKEAISKIRWILRTVDLESASFSEIAELFGVASDLVIATAATFRQQPMSPLAFGAITTLVANLLRKGKG